MERVNQVLKRLELVHVEMQPGDTLFFDCNLLHRSDQNRAERPVKQFKNVTLLLSSCNLEMLPVAAGAKLSGRRPQGPRCSGRPYQAEM